MASTRTQIAFGETVNKHDLPPANEQLQQLLGADSEVRTFFIYFASCG